MRVVITEFYSMMFRLTGAKLFSYIAGLLYLSALNFITINGLASLMNGWLGFVGLILVLFRFPISLATAVGIFGLTYWLTPTVQTVAKDAKKTSSYMTLILYSIFGMLLLTYLKFGDALFT